MRGLAKNACLAALILLTLVVMVRMATQSALNAHPDEIYHVGAARYFIDYWDFPRIGDERTYQSYSNYGVSYLQQLDVVYFLAGKFAKAIRPLVPTDYLALRYFNISLFAVLMALLFRLPDKKKLAFLPLFCSPQVWYVFSYFNGDAFPLFVSYLLVYLFARREFPVDVPSFSLKHKNVRWLIQLALVLGVLLISKQNYYVLIAFFLSFLALLAVQEGKIRLGAKNLVIMTLVAAALFGCRFAYHAYVNREMPPDAVSKMAEQFAADDMKPSAQACGESFWGMRMREQGLTFPEMFTTWNWHIWTFRTSFGVYDYMKIYAPLIHYRYVKWALLAFFLSVSLAIAQTGRKGLGVLALVLFFAGMTIFQAVYHSWINDFQAQGRYLFPIAGMGSLVMARSSEALWRHRAAILFCALALYGLGMYSFIGVGLAGITR